ncbi:hypothetical protein H696_05329 [Fonticula alba]|uniref:Peptidyl-prolyl cis-trans isomerase n=1 Tax=Fonticula alba TaxID=691883 RepID=A0A058Z3I9_FONAL|nr:hypothetical protein H696_05329 [Fonticula alba]KCV68077.1 hypothetical protein H696_05329 [Fonticula alba]|eukprot:XP_009497451.1 hypothetical protein H696_05329 [Fonticula alba]
MSVLLETILGDIVVDLFVDDCPRTCRNFLKLAKVGFFDGSPFHQIQRDFVLATGDPIGGHDAAGARASRFASSAAGLIRPEERFFADELAGARRAVARVGDQVGYVCMANAGPDRNESRFFITAVRASESESVAALLRRHTVFGIVAEGHDTLAKLGQVESDRHGAPYYDVRLRAAHLVDDPFDDPPGLAGVRLPVSEWEAERAKRGLLPETELEMVERPAAVDAARVAERSQQMRDSAFATTLTLLGDLRQPDSAPDEQVLFVARLNPLTRSGDLETIFGRFGRVTSCEVITDRKTGQSLGYAFVRFARREEAEEAYLKMDNVVIDDSRIKVDFSQSDFRHRPAGIC